MNLRKYLALPVLTIGVVIASTLLIAQTPKTATSTEKLTAQERMAYPANARLLIIHADDLGMNHSVNRATLEALENGWITSASILVPCPWFPEVARWAKLHPDADLGIHLALTSEWTDLRWSPVSGTGKVPSVVAADGYFPLDTPEVDAHAKMPDVEVELRTQIERAKSAGIQITHLDMHMAAMVSSAELFDVYRKLGAAYKIPILLETNGTHGPPTGVTVPAEEITVQRVITMEPGVAPNNKEWIEWYRQQLTPLPPGVYQLVVHLAYDDEEMRGTTRDHPDWGSAWRQRDLDMVKSTEFRQFLKDQGFVLVTWKEIAKAHQ